MTYFFNGGIEKAFSGEDRKLIPSPKVATYDLKPEMSALEVTDELLLGRVRFDHSEISQSRHGWSCRHCKSKIRRSRRLTHAAPGSSQKLLELNGKALVTADHGNCEQMRRGLRLAPHTSHTSYLVHFMYVANDAAKFRCENSILAECRANTFISPRLAATQRNDRARFLRASLARVLDSSSVFAMAKCVQNVKAIGSCGLVPNWFADEHECIV